MIIGFFNKFLARIKKYFLKNLQNKNTESCSSGLRGTPGKRVGGQPSRGFESRTLCKN